MTTSFVLSYKTPENSSLNCLNGLTVRDNKSREIEYKMGKTLRITGYHGTSEENGDQILENGYTKSGDTEWFGSGVYFFEDCTPYTNGVKEAIWWARKRKYKRWIILKSIIESDKYLDIAFCHEHKCRYERIKEELVNKHLRGGKERKDFKLRTVFIMLSKKDVDFIRAAVDAQRDQVYFSYVIERHQIQVCVKNLNCIKSTSVKMKGMSNGIRE